ncbi:MAG: glycoside hydrolase family 43 protein [Oscillibacter sp.]|nr:glycoside hydrolase family 43 protein [Oscillibacter sp.]
MDNIRNPIIPGFYPDPSICRVGDDYYLACSSFELTPGIPVFHSRDLVHWEQICNAMTEENGLHMERNCGVGGLMAPTIRYSNGVFYIINTNFADRGNYIITARDPRGPWSKVRWLDDVPGIDASIFFDNDGTACIIGTGNVWDNGTGVKERGIWLAKYDIKNFRLAGEPKTIYNSALRGGASPESPHIYHIGDYYYLITAEGGTEHFHAVMVARSRELFGFYEGFPGNPVMTHRHMGYDCPITNVGHADIVDTPAGDWYAVMLASRPIDGNHKNLGRETFLCPVRWERGWPMFSPETGRMDWEYNAPNLPQETYPPERTFDDFDGETLRLYWTMWGTPEPDTLRVEHSAASLKCVRRRLDDELQPMSMDAGRHDDWFAAYLARRQRDMTATATCAMRFTPRNSDGAGLAVVQSMNHQVHIERAVSDGRQVLRVVVVTADFDTPPYFPGFAGHTKRETVAEIPCDWQEIVLQIEMNRQTWTVRYGAEKDALKDLTVLDGGVVNPEKVGCMCGTMVGMFATGGGTDSDNRAAFDWFELV